MSSKQKENWVTLGSQSSVTTQSTLEVSNPLHFYIQHPIAGSPSYAIVCEANPRKICFRGSIGAQLALECAKSYLSILVKELNSPETLAITPPNIAESVLLEIASQWKQSITNHLKAHPLNSLEKDYYKRLEAKSGIDSTAAIYDCSLLLFSKTLTSTCVINVGSGNIFMIDEHNHFVSLPSNQSTNNLYLANSSLKTTSISTRLQDSQHQSIEFIMLSSSGYINSFKNEKGLKKAAYDFSRLMDIQGPDFVKKHLPSWLLATISQGSRQISTVIISKKVRRWYDGLSHAISREFQRIDGELTLQNKQISKLEQHYQKSLIPLQKLLQTTDIRRYDHDNSKITKEHNENSFLLELNKLKLDLQQFQYKQKIIYIIISIISLILIGIISILGIRL